MAAQDRVTGKFRPIKDISVADCLAMYNLFIQYYDNTPLDVFVRDMSKKTGVFVISKVKDDTIVGFSTIVKFPVMVDGKKSVCLFSGDTVVDRPYWGTSALRLTSFTYALKQKLLHPFTPHYWYLIAMGFRTYMVMATMFPKYYPNVEGDDSHLRDVAAAASEYLFPSAFQREKMMIHFGDDACKLKDDATPITDAERTNPKIAFFEKRNPNWMHGDEMPCIGAFDFKMFAENILQAPRRFLRWDHKKRIQSNRQGQPTAASAATAREVPASIDQQELSEAR